MTRWWGEENLRTNAPILIIREVREYSGLTWEVLTEHGVLYSYDPHLQRYLVILGGTLIAERPSRL
jgi:hypothetical protein